MIQSTGRATTVSGKSMTELSWSSAAPKACVIYANDRLKTYYSQSASQGQYYVRKHLGNQGSSFRDFEPVRCYRTSAFRVRIRFQDHWALHTTYQCVQPYF